MRNWLKTLLFLATRLVNILSDLGPEIQTLEQRLSKKRQIKQGMKQELLTRKTRLVKSEQVSQNA
jgi:restriction endonuclease S subunit